MPSCSARLRSAGWQSLTIPAAKGAKAYQITFDGSGRYSWDRTLGNGLRERVLCDGKTLWHLYPELGLASRRSVSRFHRLEWMHALPWLLPLPEDLAHGADLKLIGNDTIAASSLTPPGSNQAKGRAMVSSAAVGSCT